MHALGWAVACCSLALRDLHVAARRLPVTALALSNDDRRAYSVSKDGTIVELDVESGVRWGASTEALCMCPSYPRKRRYHESSLLSSQPKRARFTIELVSAVTAGARYRLPPIPIIKINE